MQATISFKTSSPCGDLISFLAGMRQVYLDTGCKAVIYQQLNLVGVGYQGATHPYQNSNGEDVCMNEYAFEMIKPLLLSQEYIADVQEYKGQKIDFDLDKIRLEIFTNQPHGSLNRWFFYAFPQLATDLSQQWLKVYGLAYIKTASRGEMPVTGKIIINFTHRYRNHMVDYFFLKEYQDEMLFVGLPNEHEDFCKKWGLDMPLVKVKDFLELARTISSAKFFLGNQSFCYQLAEATKTPRILETFQLMPNVIPVGENAFDFYHNNALQYYFNKLLNK